MKLSSLSTIAAVVITMASALSAQNLLRYRPSSPLPIQERPAPSRAWSRSAPGPGLIQPNLPGPTRAFLAHPNGAITIDSTTGWIFSTNGAGVIDRTEYSRIGSATGATIPPLPFPAGVARVTGMTFDPVARHLFLTDGLTIYEVDPAAGMAVLTAFPASPLNFLAGLSYDPADPLHVYAVSTAGEVATYSRGGGLIAVSPAIYSWPGAPAVGLSLYKTASACRDFHVLHGNGNIYNHTLGDLIHTGAGNHVGMAFLPSPVLMPSVGACGGAGMDVRTSKLVVDGIAGFGLEIDLPLGTPFVAWFIEVLPACPPPLALLSSIGLCGSDVWVTAPVFSSVVAASSGGATVLPLTLPPGFVGTTLVAQPLVPCAASACGFVLPDAMHLEICSG
jgi:hypothetical protein